MFSVINIGSLLILFFTIHCQAGYFWDQQNDVGPDLYSELFSKKKNNKRIKIYCESPEKIKVDILSGGLLSPREELKQRNDFLKLFLKINLLKESDLSLQRLSPSQKTIVLIKKFALSDSGAIWLRRVTADTVEAINNGYYILSPSAANCDSISGLVTGELSEKAIFDPFFSRLQIYEYIGYGAVATSGSIGFGSLGFKKKFISSKELVDPIAIISHEFGHTKYGDPTTSGFIQGEAYVVKKYENPVRIKNGYTPRTSYCEISSNTSIDIESGKISNTDCRGDKDSGISE